jgi:hypothetical protein
VGPSTEKWGPKNEQETPLSGFNFIPGFKLVLVVIPSHLSLLVEALLQQ